MISLRTSRVNLRAPSLRQSSPKLYSPAKFSPQREEISGDVRKRKSVSRGPGKHWLRKPAVVIFPDGREICNPATDEGRAEYKYRTICLWVRQDGWCCFREYDFCPGRLHLAEATMEHENKRTRARQDDRIVIHDEAGRFVKHQNGAAHAECNRIAGSRMLPIYHGGNAFIEKQNC